MRYLGILLLLAGCKASSAEIAAARCDPTSDLEQCDDTASRRMACNSTNGQWTPVEMCYAPQVCVASDPNDAGQRVTVCQVPNADFDAFVGDNDAIAPGDVGYPDAKFADAKSDAADAKPGDTGAADSGPPAPDVPQAGGTISHQNCFALHCPLQTQNCLKSSTCIAAIDSGVDCIVACGGGQGCIVQCQNKFAGDTTAYLLASCGMLVCASGCGDGECSANETPITCPGDCKVPTTGSCVGYCGGKSTDCYCDAVCKNQGDCCNDYLAVCSP